MHILEVIPLTTLPHNAPQVLSYYSPEDLPIGAVVVVPLHHRHITSVVISSSAIAHQKLLLKKSEFQLKHIDSIVSATPLVGTLQLRLARWLADTYLAPLGACLKTVLPPFFGVKKYHSPAPVAPENSEFNPLPLTIISRAKESHKHIAPFFKKPSGHILILVPEISHLHAFADSIEKTTLVHSGLSKREWRVLWEKAQHHEPLVFIGTRQALFLPFSKLETIIVTDPLHEFYKSDSAPTYWAPALATKLAHAYGAQYIHLSDILTIANYYEIVEKRRRVDDPAAPWRGGIQIVDRVAEMKDGSTPMVISPAARDAIADTLSQKKQVLIFSARRGYSGIAVCNHCGYKVPCPRCDTFLRIHQSVESLLLCHRCGYNQPLPSLCPNCKNGGLHGSGPAGSQKLFSHLQRMMDHGQIPRVPMVILDADATQNQTEEDEILATIRLKNPSILIATQKIFSYIYDLSFDLVVVPSFDSLSSSPDYQTTERLWYQLEKLADFNFKNLILQTYDPSPTVHHLAAHEVKKLCADELAVRERYLYPPFVRLVRLSFTHKNRAEVTRQSHFLIEKLRMAAAQIGYEKYIRITEISPASLRKERDLFTGEIILKILPTIPSLRALLRYAPAGWHIDVDPRQLL